MLFLIFLIARAFALPEPILLPTGPGHLGLVLPSKKRSTDRLDAVLIHPRTGKLWVEHSDDLSGYRVYYNGQWDVSDLAAYEYKGQQLVSATDIWSVKVQYEYEKEELSSIKWPSGREVRILYDDQERVKKMVDSSGQVLTVRWWNDQRATMTDSLGYSVQWSLLPGEIWVKDSLGNSVRGFYEEGLFVGWDDPRGRRSRVEREGETLFVKDSYAKTWTIGHEKRRISSLAISGVGTWSWKRNHEGDIFEIVDPSRRVLTLNRSSVGTARLKRRKGYIDFSYDSEGRLRGITDAGGRLLRIKRDSFGQIVEITDALGGVISFDRSVGGQLRRLILRNGQEWNFEYDNMRRLRNIIGPNQEVIALSRNSASQIIAIDYAGKEKMRISRDIRGNIRSIEETEGVKRSIRIDALNRVRSDSRNNLKMSYDALGNISSFSTDGKDWKITRDVYGQIQRWNGLSFVRSSMGHIVSIQDSSGDWVLQRDALGRLEVVQRGDKLLSVEYDELGYPSVWIEGEKRFTVERNVYGWTTTEGEIQLDRDRRGWITGLRYGDSDWQWRRDGSGFALQAFFEKKLRLGLERSDSGQLVALKFPNGAYQRWILQQEALLEKVVGVDGQVLEKNRYQLFNGEWGSLAEQVFQDQPIEASLYEYDTVGLRVRENKDNLQVYDYDSFGRLTQVCGVGGCHHFFYDPLGRLIGYQDSSNLPVGLLWGRNGIEDDGGGFEMVPLLHGGESWLLSPFGTGLFWGFNDFAEGYVFSLLGRQNWRIQGNEIFSTTSMVDREKTMYLQGDSLVYEPLGLSFRGSLVWNEEEQRYLQSDALWHTDTQEAQLFAWASRAAIWNRPLEILMGMGLLHQEAEWSSTTETPVIPWLNDSLQQEYALPMPTVQSYPFREEGMEQYVLLQLLEGKTDPSSQTIVSHLIAQEFPEIPTFFQNSTNKCVASLAFFFQCG